MASVPAYEREGATAAPVAAPPVQSTEPKEPILGGRMGSLISVGVRIGQVLFSLLALILLASSGGCGGYDFTDSHSLNYLLAAVVIQFAWSVAMLIVGIVSLVTRYAAFGELPFGIAQFTGDFIVTFLTFSAFAAAAGFSTDTSAGLCEYCESFCGLVRAATSFAFFTFLLDLPSFFHCCFILFSHLR